MQQHAKPKERKVPIVTVRCRLIHQVILVILRVLLKNGSAIRVLTTHVHRPADSNTLDYC